MPGSLSLAFNILTSQKKKNLVYMVFPAFLAQFSLAFTSEIVLSKVHNDFLIILCLVLIFVDPLGARDIVNHSINTINSL